MKFSIFQESRLGGRKTNQDRTGYVYSKGALMMVVADGMGGHMHGEIAAQLAVEYLASIFQKTAKPTLEDPAAFLRESIVGAHRAIFEYAEKKALLETPRTTIVVCIVQAGYAWWAHVGDSRLYWLRGPSIVAQTIDHSRVAQLVQQGVVSEEAVAVHPERNRIFNCLGAHMSPNVEVGKRAKLQNGDTLVLCTDGLWGPLVSKTISQAFAAEGILTAAPRFMQLAQQKAGADADNISVVVMTWNDGEHGNDPDAHQTGALPDNGYSTRIDPMSVTGRMSALSDDEIEKAIREINSAIAKTTRF